jgi:hypothetical protein
VTLAAGERLQAGFRLETRVAVEGIAVSAVKGAASGWTGRSTPKDLRLVPVPPPR